MKYASEIMDARVFMGGECVGEHDCVSCGLSMRASTNYKQFIKTNFCNYDELLLSRSVYLCDSCAALMNDKDMRFKPVFFREFGKKEIPERGDVLEIIQHPLEKFVLSVPYSFKKHHWLFAGLSDRHRALIGTDSRTVVIDYEKFDVRKIIGEIIRMVNAGVPRKEIVCGKYSSFTRKKYPWIEDSEIIIDGLRPCGAVELAVKYTPATTEKIKIEGSERMITQSERMAAYTIYSIAATSQVRIDDGIRFWGGFLERRVNRFKELPLHEFVSKLSASVGASHNIGVKDIEEMSEEMELQVMEDIREKTSLIIALAYTYNKEKSL